MIWYALFIPIFISITLWILFRKKLVWWEVLIPTVICAVFIVTNYYVIKSQGTSDSEFNTYVVVEARYYEAWETWVEKQCSRQVPCGTEIVMRNDVQTTVTKYCTEYYDCSYCDFTDEYYEMIDSGGNKTKISKVKYLALLKKWGVKPVFHDMNRMITYREEGFFRKSKCGFDGNMYSIKWGGDPLTSETTSYHKSYTNVLKTNQSVFNYPTVTKEDAVAKGLYEYPTIGSYKHQPSTIGINKVANLSTKDKYEIERTLDYFNGFYGYQHKIKIFTLFFKNKDIQTSFLQEAYWSGGNQNEIVVCINVDDSGKFQWVRAFSWCDNKRVIVDIREELMMGKTINANLFLNTYRETVSTNWKYKDFEDFNYLSFQPTYNQLLFTYVVTFIISIFFGMWSVHNEYDNED